jgi:hypothetical protein
MLAPQFAPTLVIYGDVVAFAGGCRLNVFSAADGSELWRADYLISAIALPAGRHTVRFEFRHRSLQIGAAVTITTLVIALGLLTVSVLRRRRQAHSPGVGR